MREYTFPDMRITPLPQFTGLRIIRDINMTETVEDWSRVRSPGRARRRRKLGHPQNIVHRKVPKKEAVRIGDQLVMHPETAKAFERLMQETADNIHQKMMEEVMGGDGYAMSRTTASDGALTMEHLTKWRLP